MQGTGCIFVRALNASFTFGCITPSTIIYLFFHEPSVTRLEWLYLSRLRREARYLKVSNCKWGICLRLQSFSISESLSAQDSSKDAFLVPALITHWIWRTSESSWTTASLFSIWSTRNNKINRFLKIKLTQRTRSIGLPIPIL